MRAFVALLTLAGLLGSFAAPVAERFHEISGLTITHGSTAADQRRAAREPYGRRLAVSFRAFEEEHDMELVLLDQLLSEGAKVVVRGADEEVLEERPARALSYHGFHKGGGWARFTVMADGQLSGAWVVGDDLHVMQPQAMHPSSGRGHRETHVAYRASEMTGQDEPAHVALMEYLRKGRGDGGEETKTNTNLRRGRLLEADYFKYSEFIRYNGPYGLLINCTEDMQDLYALEIGVAADVGYGQRISDSDTVDVDAVEADLQFNNAIANVIFSDQLNVFLTIAEMDVRTSGDSDTGWNQAPADRAAITGDTRTTDGCTVSTDCGSSCQSTGNDYGTYLDAFKSWRTDKVTAEEYGLWHAMTDCFPPYGTIGLAYVGATCTTSAVGWTSYYEGKTWETYTHELGHNLGAAHTFGEGGIMDYLTYPDFVFVDSNSESMCEHVIAKKDVCYTGAYSVMTATCGNGIVEPGEDCDDDTKCCTSECALQANAQCTPAGSGGSECCTSECMFEPTTTDCMNGYGFCKNGVCGSNCYWSATSYHCSTPEDEACHEHCTGLVDADTCSDATTYTSYDFSTEALMGDGVVCSTSPYKECQSGSCVAATEPEPVPDTTPRVYMTAPADDAYWVRGDNYTVAWTTEYLEVETVNVRFLAASDGVTVAADPLTDVAADLGSLTWRVDPALVADTYYLVRVEATDGSAWDNATVLVDDPPSISVVAMPANVTAGRTYSVEWTTKGAVGDVSVSLVLPDDETSVLLSSSSAAAESSPFEWTVDAARLGQHRVVVSDSAGVAGSSDFFEILEVHSLTLAEPADDVWYVGENVTLAWTTTGAITGAVVLSLQPANASWPAVELGTFPLSEGGEGVVVQIPAEAEMPEGGAALWATGTSGDASAASTALTVSADLSVSQPGGEDVFQAGDVVSVAWTGVWSADVYLVSASGAVVVQGLLSNAAAPGAEATLNISLPTGQYFVRVEALERDLVAESAVFDVNVYPAFTAVETNATWTKGEPAYVWWGYYGGVASVDVLLLRDGAQVLQLAAGADRDLGALRVDPDAADGVEPTVGDAYVVEVRDSAQPEVSLLSSALTVRGARSLALSAPLDNATLYYDEAYTVAWTAVSTDDANTTLELLLHGVAVLSWEAPTADGAVEWTVPAELATSEHYELRASSGAVSDAALSLNIEVRPSFTVLTPDGANNDTWVRSRSYNMTWTETGRITPPLTVAVLLPTGLPEAILTRDLPAGQGWYEIDLSSLPAGSYRAALADDVSLAYGESAELFTVVEPEISVEAPLAAAVWTKGETHSVEWGWTGGDAETLHVDLLDGDSAFVVRLAEDVSAAQGALTYAVPLSGVEEPLEGGNYTVHFEWTADAAVAARSAGDLTVKGQPSVTVTAPADGDYMYFFTTHTITWATTNTDATEATVELLNAGEVVWSVVVDDGSESYAFLVSDEELAIGYDYAVRVSLSGGNVTDTTGALSVNYMPEVTLVHPSERIVVLVGDVLTVVWSTLGDVSPVSVSLLLRSTEALHTEIDFEVAGTTLDWAVEAAAGEYVLHIASPEAETYVNIDVADRPAIALADPGDWVQTRPATVSWTFAGQISSAELSLYSYAWDNYTVLAADQALSAGAFLVDRVSLPLGDYFLQMSNVNVTAQSVDFRVESFVFLAFLDPTADSVWVHDTNETVTWEGSVDAATVDVYLGGEFLLSLGSAAAGYIALTVLEADLPASDDYTLLVTDDGDAEHTAWSEVFEVEVEPLVLSASVVDTDVLTKGDDFEVEYTTQGSVDLVDVLLLRESVLVLELAVNETNVGSLTTALPTSEHYDDVLVPGDSYRIEVRDSGNYALSALSGYVTVRDEPSIDSVLVETASGTNDTWWRESTYEVTWESTSIDDESVTVSLLVSGTDVVVDSREGVSPFAWTVDAARDLALEYYVLVEAERASARSEGALAVLAKPALALDLGETPWQRGSEHVVELARENVPSASVELTDLEGAFVHLIAADASGDSVAWTVDASVAAGDYLVRASGNTAEAVAPVTVASPTLSVVLPEAVWTKGTTVDIQFPASGTLDAVDITLLRDGALAEVIASGFSVTSAYAFEYELSLADADSPVPATGYSVQVQWSQDSTVANVSAEFEIRTSPYVTLETPAGGESYVFETAYLVSWTSASTDADTVQFSLLRNGSAVEGADFETANDGLHEWTTPAESAVAGGGGALFQLQVTAGGYSDTSEYFSLDVPAGITVTAPAEDATVVAGEALVVQWTTVGAVDTVDVRLALFQSGAVHLDIALGVDASLGEVSLAALDAAAGEYKVQVQAADALGESARFFVEDAPALSLTNPGTWQLDVAQTVSWTLTGAWSATTDTVELSVCAAAAAAACTTVGSGIDPTALSFSFTPSSADFAVGTSYTVRAVVASLSFEDESEPFDVATSAVALALLSPAAGDVWIVGEEVVVSWEGGASGAEVEVALYAGEEFVAFVDEAASAGFAVYEVAAEAGDDYTVRLNVDEAVSGVFSIEVPPALSDVGFSDDVWVMGDSVALTWAWEGSIAAVDVAVVNPLGGVEATLAAGAANIGYLVVDVPELPSADGYTLQVTDSSDVYVSASSSPDSFNVRGYLVVTAPVAAQQVLTGETLALTWESASVAEVALSVTRLTDGVELLVEERLINTGSYSWVVGADAVGGYVQFAVSDYEFGDVLAESDSFSIAEGPSLSFIQPVNNNDYWTHGTAQSITWASTGDVVEVALWMTQGFDDDTVLLTLGEHVVNTGEFEWVVPTSLATAVDYRFHLASTAAAQSDSVTATSGFVAIQRSTEDSTFTLVAPEAGASLEKGSTVAVEWTATGSNVTDVRLSLWSRGDPDVEVLELVASTPNANAFSWTLAAAADAAPVAGTSYYLRVESVGFSQDVVDDSGFFSIVDEQEAVALDSIDGDEWERGTTVSVAFSTSSAVAAVDVALVDEDGLAVAWLAESLDAAASPLSWTVPDMAPPARGDRYGVVIYDAADADTSARWPGVLSIVDGVSTPVAIDISRPRLGHRWVRGQELEVKWTSTGLDAVDIALFAESGALALTLGTGVTSTGYAAYALSLDDAEGLADGDYELRVTDADSDVVDTKAIEIDSPNVVGRADLDVDEPTAASEWVRGASATVTWDSINIGEACDVFLLGSAGGQWTLATDQGTADSIEVTVPASLAPGAGYWVEVRSVDGYGANITAASAAFAVFAEPSLNVWKPLSGATLFKGSAYNVRWNHTGPDFDVALELFQGDPARRTVGGALCVPSVDAYGVYYADCRADEANPDVEVCATAADGELRATAEGVCADVSSHLVRVSDVASSASLPASYEAYYWRLPATTGALPSPGADYVVKMVAADQGLEAYSPAFSVAFREVRVRFQVVYDCQSIADPASAAYATWAAQVQADVATALGVATDRVRVLSATCVGGGRRRRRRRLLADEATDVEVQLLSSADLQAEPAEDLGSALAALVADGSSTLYAGVVTSATVSTVAAAVEVVDASEVEVAVVVSGGDDDSASGSGGSGSSGGGGGGTTGTTDVIEDDDNLFGDLFDWDTANILMLFLGLGLCCCCCFGSSAYHSLKVWRADRARVAKEIEASREARAKLAPQSSSSDADSDDEPAPSDFGGGGLKAIELTETDFEHTNPSFDPSDAEDVVSSESESESDSEVRPAAQPESASAPKQKPMSSGMPNAQQMAAMREAAAAQMREQESAAALGAGAGAAAGGGLVSQQTQMTPNQMAAVQASQAQAQPNPHQSQLTPQQMQRAPAAPQFTPQQVASMQQLQQMHQAQQVQLLQTMQAQGQPDAQMVANMRQLQQMQAGQQQQLLQQFQMQNHQAAMMAQQQQPQNMMGMQQPPNMMMQNMMGGQNQNMMGGGGQSPNMMGGQRMNPNMMGGGGQSPNMGGQRMNPNMMGGGGQSPNMGGQGMNPNMMGGPRQ